MITDNPLEFDTQDQTKPLDDKIYQAMEVAPFMRQIGDLKIRIEELKQKIFKMENDNLKERETYILASKSWQKEMEAKEKEQEDLLKVLEKTKQECDEKIQNLTAQKDEEISKLKDEIFQLDYKSNKRIADLAEELRRLREFKEKQNAYFNQINYYKVKYEELSKGDHQLVINNNNNASSQQGPLITEKLPESPKSQEDQFHIEDGPEKGNLLGINQDQKILEFQLDFFRQQMKIRNYKEKVKNLQTLFDKETSEYSKQVETLKYQCQGKIIDLETQIKELQNELKSKLQENKQLKSLSQIILNQRSEVEEFLLSSLNHAKEEIKKAPPPQKHIKLPSFGPPKTANTIPVKKTWDKSDFTSFTWEEKEKILQKLYSKFNSTFSQPNSKYSRGNSSFEDDISQSNIFISTDRYKLQPRKSSQIPK